MKTHWKELAFLCKLIDKKEDYLPFEYELCRYIKVWNTLYSELVFSSPYFWNVANAYYNDTKNKDEPAPTSLLSEINNWDEIFLEDINTFDAVGNIAWIEWYNYWISINQLKEYLSLVDDVKYLIKISKSWLMAFVNTDWTPFVVFGLFETQTSLAIN